MDDEPLRLFNKPHKKRSREADFRCALVDAIGADHVPQDFRMSAEALTHPIDTHRLRSWLCSDRFLPRTRRQRCIEILGTLPEQIFVALDPRRISFDFVIVRGAKEFYLEFHEEQHVKLTDDRPKEVYDASGKGYRVPRFVQRLIRDVWRIQEFPNYTIVWHDWFAKNRGMHVLWLADGFHEYHLQDAFSFQVLCQNHV